MDAPEQNGGGGGEEGKGGILERIRQARRWFWQSWTDEAILVYRRSAQGGIRARVRMVELFLFARELYREFWRTEVTSRAASLAYTTLLSLIPLIAAFSERLGGWFANAVPEFRARLDQFLNLVIPYDASQFAHHINGFVDKAGAASGLGGIVFLVISFRLFMAVEGAVNQFWKVETQRGYRQRLRTFTMALFWGPVLIGVGFTTLRSIDDSSYIGGIIYSRMLANIFPVLVLFVGFTMLFWLVPATRVRFKSAAIGAVASAILFELVRFGFTYYATALFGGRLNVIYGTLGLFIIFLVALELMWIVILLGVAVSYVYQNLQGILRASEHQLDDHPAHDLYFALRALIEVSRRFEQREDAPSSYRLAEEFGATDSQMARVLRKLEEAGLVKQVGGEWTGNVPGGDPDRISVEEVIPVIEGKRALPPAPENDPVREQIARVFQIVGGCTHESLEGVTIGQLVRELYGQRQPNRSTDYLSPAREL
ncbi:MAG TPA: YhjD/YihY/BrkB family envelope integrity protein [Thermoanaerobaculia bacterium]|nr:YhjD/YihY/BrkB family envelope integrity protein [Thermoanaerobaculia bacterium]